MKIKFKSKSPFFEKERDNLKCNTVRSLNFDDVRYEYLMDYIQTKCPMKIEILNPDTQESFERQVSDVTYYDERFIISWKYGEIENEK